MRVGEMSPNPYMVTTMSYLFSKYSVLLIGQHNVDYDVLLRGNLFCIHDFVLEHVGTGIGIGSRIFFFS